ncbi:MAG: hypothetical protein HYZ75_15305 [Elusimicrobia bacterium]|nr:hypothetical protein [Elusimicrobiota bacterium]
MTRSRTALSTLAALLLAGCASDEDREVVFPRGTHEVCTRPAPRPAIFRGGPLLLSHQFRALGPGRAVETARLAGGIMLKLHHEACERQSQAFRFYLPKGQAAPGNPAATYALAARFMRGLAAPGPDGDALRELAQPLAAAAAKGGAAPPLAGRIALGEFQELLVNVSPGAETSAYGPVLVVTYRLKV